MAMVRYERVDNPHSGGEVTQEQWDQMLKNPLIQGTYRISDERKHSNAPTPPETKQATEPVKEKTDMKK